MKRSYEECKLTDQGRPHDHSSDFYQDQVYVFFQNCWHLKEWIKNDTSAGVYKELRDSIYRNPEMRLCRDICDGIKHLELDRKTEDPQVAQRKFKVDVGIEPTTISVKYTIETSNGRTIDAFELATKCLEFWEKFLVKRGLL